MGVEQVQQDEQVVRAFLEVRDAWDAGYAVEVFVRMQILRADPEGCQWRHWREEERCPACDATDCLEIVRLEEAVRA